MRDDNWCRPAAAAAEVRTLPAGLEFAISSRRLENGTFVVGAIGELDLHTSPELERALEEPVSEGVTQLVVDLSGVTFVDSTALHVLVRAARQRDGQEAALIVVVPDPKVRKVFEITGCDRLVSVVASLPNVSVAS